MNKKEDMNINNNDNMNKDNDIGINNTDVNLDIDKQYYHKNNMKVTT